jgi:hypothetical protein
MLDLIQTVGSTMDGWGSIVVAAAAQPGCTAAPSPALARVAELSLWGARCDKEQWKKE